MPDWAISLWRHPHVIENPRVMWKKNTSRSFLWNVFERIDEEQASPGERSAGLEPAKHIAVVGCDIWIATEAAYGDR